MFSKSLIDAIKATLYTCIVKLEPLGKHETKFTNTMHVDVGGTVWRTIVDLSTPHELRSSYNMIRENCQKHYKAPKEESPYLKEETTDVTHTKYDEFLTDELPKEMSTTTTITTKEETP